MRSKLVTVHFPDGELGFWACLGGVTDRSVRVWLRDPSGGSHQARLELADETLAETILIPDPEHDWIAASELVLPEPRPDRAFLVRVAGLERRGRLAPQPGTPSAFAFGFGSCHQPFAPGPDGALRVHRGAKIYASMADLLRARQARFLMLVGDQIYSDGVPPIQLRDQSHRLDPPPSDEALRARYRWLYRGYFNQTDFRRLLESQPTLMIWDDHDICEGWGSLLDWDELDGRLFRAAEATFREYQHLRQIGARVDDQAPYHARFWYGDVGFFVLDLRGLRSYRDGRLLGERQWADLEVFLQEADERSVPTVFFVSSIPVVHHSPTFAHLLEWLPVRFGADIRDRWTSGPIAHERAAFLERVLSWQARRPGRQAVVLSGDVHAGAAFRYTGARGHGQLLQWTSSALSTHPKAAERLANYVGTALVGLGDRSCTIERQALVPKNNFGLVEVQPLPGGGHHLELTVFGRGRQAHTIHELARVVALPRGRT